MKKMIILMLAVIFIVASCEKKTEDTEFINANKKNTLTTQTVSFNEGWNIFSLYVEPVVIDAEEVFAEIADKITIMKTWGLKTEVWWPEYQINGIDLDCRVSYLVKCTDNCSIDIPGEITQVEVELLEGWQMVGFPETEYKDGQEYYFPDFVETDIAKNINGSKIIWPWYGFNAIVSPGDGFLLHNDTGKGKGYEVEPQKLYFNLNGKQISISQCEGWIVVVTPIEQWLEYIAPEWFKKINYDRY
ncbi:MAG: hypothetical protein EOL88_02345 [Bacteroidia bacterium]|nr:hypothetical protein [Bacteroidia bacterium]